MHIPLRNTAHAYGAIAQGLHWLIVAGIGLQYLWAWRIDEADSVRAEFVLVTQHKSIGMTILLLVLIRIVWRLVDPPPALPATMRGWEQRAAALTHWLLYALILAMPLSGWAYTSAAGYGPEFWGLIDLPGLVPVHEDLEDWFEDVHETLATAIWVVVALHVAAALRHALIKRDGVLGRMLPLWNRRPTGS